jgi:hypothetical protein
VVDPRTAQRVTPVAAGAVALTLTVAGVALFRRRGLITR